MTHALQKKFVITAMIAVTVLQVVVLGALNVFNAVSNARQSDRLLDELARQNMLSVPSDGFSLHALPDGPGGENSEGTDPVNSSVAPDGPWGRFRSRQRGFLDDPMDDNARMSAIYFTVDMDAHCQVLHTDVSHIASVTEEEATAYALSLNADDTEGSISSYRYRIYHRPDGGYSIVFLDGAARRSAVMRVALLSLLVGFVSWLLMLALVIALSRRMIRPIAENMERQRQFVTDAGHELKTPVAIILANVDAMELRTGESKYSRNIRSQAGRLSDLMKNLLTLARVDEYSVLEQPQEIDFTALGHEIFDSFREAAELRHIRYLLSLEDNVLVRGDRTMLSQLCSILADNAVKYCPENGEIQISLLTDGQKPCLRVSNSVTEVPDLSRIFDRFYRADSSRNQKSGGFGIGLSAARTIARLHRAELTADYDDRSEMLCFCVRFPS